MAEPMWQARVSLLKVDSSIVVWASDVEGARAECAESGRARTARAILSIPRIYLLQRQFTIATET